MHIILGIKCQQLRNNDHWHKSPPLKGVRSTRHCIMTGKNQLQTWKEKTNKQTKDETVLYSINVWLQMKNMMAGVRHTAFACLLTALKDCQYCTAYCCWWFCKCTDWTRLNEKDGRESPYAELHPVRGTEESRAKSSFLFLSPSDSNCPRPSACTVTNYLVAKEEMENYTHSTLNSFTRDRTPLDQLQRGCILDPGVVRGG